MPRRYVLLRQNGATPRVEFLGVFSRSSGAKERAEQLAHGLAWEDHGQPRGPLQIAEAHGTAWHLYAIVRLEDDELADPPVAL